MTASNANSTPRTTVSGNLKDRIGSSLVRPVSGIGVVARLQAFPGGKGVRRKGCQVPFPGRHGFLTVLSSPNCATALLTHPSDPYGLLLFIACRIFSTSSLGCERLSHSRYSPGSGTGHGLSNPFWLSSPYRPA